MEYMDNVVVPKTLPAGDYVLSWRWSEDTATAQEDCLFALADLLPDRAHDHGCLCVCRDCEESTQVWNSCADITVKH